MTFYQADVKTIDKETRSIAKLLDEEEIKWFESQHEITKAKLAEKWAKAVRKDDRMNDILRICKEHGGPFTSVEEIEKALKNTKDDKEQKKMLRNELLIWKQMCKRDQRENPALYKENGMSVAQMKVNLGVLLSGNHEKDLEGTVVFPDESTMLSILDDPNYEVVVDEESSNVIKHEIPLNEPCAVIWDNPNGREWFIGMAQERISKDEYLIDYLEPDPKDTSKKHWQYPHKDDQQQTKAIPTGFALALNYLNFVWEFRLVKGAKSY